MFAGSLIKNESRLECGRDQEKGSLEPSQSLSSPPSALRYELIRGPFPARTSKGSELVYLRLSSDGFLTVLTADGGSVMDPSTAI
jgi:hypothetical protein